MNVRFCESCRSLILSEFRFCPYCGAEVPRGPGLAEALDAPFERLEGSRAGTEADCARSERRFKDLVHALDRMDEELDLIFDALKRGGEGS
jgi:hypothetical protein